MASKTTSINFKEYFNEEYEFLMAQHNKSLFICELIREYMNGGDIQNVRSSQVTPPPPNVEVKKEKRVGEEKKKEKKSLKISGVIG